MRQNIINITNELAQGAGLDFDLMETYKVILNYCIKTKTHATPRKNQYNIINGCLYINNQFIKRVAPLPRKVGSDPVADYYENKILTRQEQYYI